MRAAKTHSVTSRWMERRRRRKAGRGDTPERIAEADRGVAADDVSAVAKRTSGALVANGASFNG